MDDAFRHDVGLTAVQLDMCPPQLSGKHPNFVGFCMCVAEFAKNEKREDCCDTTVYPFVFTVIRTLVVPIDTYRPSITA